LRGHYYKANRKGQGGPKKASATKMQVGNKWNSLVGMQNDHRVGSLIPLGIGVEEGKNTLKRVRQRALGDS